MAGRAARATARDAAGWPPLRATSAGDALEQARIRHGRGGLVSELRQPVRRGTGDAAHRDGFLPAHRAVQALLPWPGLRRGATIAVTGSTSLLYAVLAAGMRDGGWAAIVGIPALGLAAAAEHDGMDLNRLALVPYPGPDWPKVAAALIGGVDLLAIAAPAPPTADAGRMLAARARQHGTVLIPTRTGWPGCDLQLDATGRAWTGLGHGHGRLHRQEIDVVAAGRGAAARPKQARLTMPLPEPPAGTVDAVTEADRPPSVIARPWQATA
jgi:hypothetical protein